MIALESSLSNRELDYAELKQTLERHWFTLGGNWDYNHGSFDRQLDGERRTVWLRIPFSVTQGELDPIAPQPGTRVVVGTPYVLRHLYNEGDDHTAHFYAMGALVDQFQSPVDPDAQVQSSYIEDARDVLQSVEAAVQ